MKYNELYIKGIPRVDRFQYKECPVLNVFEYSFFVSASAFLVYSCLPACLWCVTFMVYAPCNIC